MANKTIPQLPAATTIIPGVDVLPISHSGVTQKATPDQVVQAVLPSPGPIGGTTPDTAEFSALTVTGAVGLQKAVAGLFTDAVAGTDYLGPTTGTAIQKANGSGGLTNAVSGADYAPATSGNSILYGNGSGGFSSVTVGSGLSFAGGTLSSVSGGGTVTSVSVVSANGLAGTVANPTTTPAITLSTTTSGILYGNSGALSAVTVGSGLTFAGGVLSAISGGGGTVTDVSVVSANGFSGTVATSTTTPAITLGTTVTGLLKGNGTAISAATAGTDYASPGANSDITSLSGLTGGISTPDFVQFDTGATFTSAIGKIGWNGGTTLNLGMTANVTQKIGEDTFIYAKASSAITKGDLCMFTGTVGASGVITAAPATGMTVAQYIVGIAAENIALNGFGLIQWFGNIRGIDTTGSSVGETWLDGDILYYNSAFTGKLTKVYPASGPIIQVAAVVNAASSGNGDLLIRPSFIQRITTSAPLAVSQTASGSALSITQASSSTNGYLSSTDWTTFNSKAPATSGTSILYGNGSGGFSNVTIGSNLTFVGGTLSATGGGGMTYPAAGMAVSTGSAWGTSKTTPTGDVVGTSDSQTLTNKTLTAAGSNTVEATSGPTSTQLGGNRNKIINGAMAVDQRNLGASQTITAGAALAYTVDRWYAYCTGANVTGQRAAGSTASSQYNYQFTGAASVTGIGFAQRIEAINCYDLANNTATLSVNLANSSLTTVTWTAYYANTADTFGTLASPTVTQIATGTFTVNSTITRYSTNISIPSAATTGIQIVFSVGAQTSGTWTIGSVQLEKGATATPFENRLYGTELALCQRYYQKMTSLTVAGYTNSPSETYYSGTTSLLVEMRATPTLSLSGFVNNNSGNAVASGVSARCFRFFATSTTTGSAYSLFNMETTGVEL